ncbi:MAG: hypothetical protein JWP37_1439 [Mucilaginibacter sp.]|nr:hypothetical protein [Mucilaginibacter sp.]
MKHKYLLLIITCSLLSLITCKKEGDRYPIVGKWKEIKVRIYLKNYSGDISRDTTYLGTAFNNSDYVQFNNNESCILGTDHIFNPAGSGPVAEYMSTISFNFTPVGHKFVLSYPFGAINPGGFITRDTISLSDPNTLLIHSVSDSHINYTISDAYYSNDKKLF